MLRIGNEMPEKLGELCESYKKPAKKLREVARSCENVAEVANKLREVATIPRGVVVILNTTVF